MLGVTALIGCVGDPNDISVQLSPDVISSIDGTLAVHALVLADRDPVAKGKTVDLAIQYTDRNGTVHMIAPISGPTDERGALDATFSGLTWDGTGTVTATSGKATGEATFAVLDRTPPKVAIVPPANNSVHANADQTINVHVTDEIGVSEAILETSLNGGGRQRTTIVASGSTDVTIPFQVNFNDAAVGQTVTVYALAGDLSGNEAAATPIMVMVTP
ncbi:MAG TPA: hypothetical protein VFT22_22630 [Kofleriaceae bacterium]|nr:hypothetical protein [Kofleriaceae bacterium]